MRRPWPTGGCCTKWGGGNLITDTTTTLLYLLWTIGLSLSNFKHPQGFIVINSGTFIVDSTPISRILCLTFSQLITFYSTFTYCKNVTQMRFYKYFMYRRDLACNSGHNGWQTTNTIAGSDSIREVHMI